MYQRADRWNFEYEARRITVRSGTKTRDCDGTGVLKLLLGVAAAPASPPSASVRSVAFPAQSTRRARRWLFSTSRLYCTGTVLTYRSNEESTLAAAVGSPEKAARNSCRDVNHLSNEGFTRQAGREAAQVNRMVAYRFRCFLQMCERLDASARRALACRRRVGVRLRWQQHRM